MHDVCLHLLVPPLAQCCYFDATLVLLAKLHVLWHSFEGGPKLYHFVSYIVIDDGRMAEW